MFPGLSRKVESKEKFCYNDAYENQTGGCQDMITIAIVDGSLTLLFLSL